MIDIFKQIHNAIITITIISAQLPHPDKSGHCSQLSIICLYCCQHDTSIVRILPVHLVNEEEHYVQLTLRLSQLTWAISLRVGCYHLHLP